MRFLQTPLGRKQMACLQSLSCHRLLQLLLLKNLHTKAQMSQSQISLLCHLAPKYKTSQQPLQMLPAPRKLPHPRPRFWILLDLGMNPQRRILLDPQTMVHNHPPIYKLDHSSQDLGNGSLHMAHQTKPLHTPLVLRILRLSSMLLNTRRLKAIQLHQEVHSPVPLEYLLRMPTCHHHQSINSTLFYYHHRIPLGDRVPTLLVCHLML